MAGALGFEPRLADPESAVLPLYDAPKNQEKLFMQKICVSNEVSLSDN